MTEEKNKDRGRESREGAHTTSYSGWDILRKKYDQGEVPGWFASVLVLHVDTAVVL